MNSLRSAHTRRPAYTLCRSSIRHQTLETPPCRLYKVPIPGTQGHPRDPTPTPTPQGTQGGAKGPGGARGPKGAFGALGGDGPMGPFGVIPKPLRMESHFEWKVITKGSYSEMKVVAKESRPKANGSKWQQN